MRQVPQFVLESELRADAYHGSSSSSQQRRPEETFLTRIVAAELRLQAFGVIEHEAGIDTTRIKCNEAGNSYSNKLVQASTSCEADAEHFKRRLLIRRKTLATTDLQSAKTENIEEDEAWQSYLRRTSKSRQIYREATRVLPGGVTYAVRYYDPYPFFAKKGTGSKIWDVDGNQYTDYWMGHGALIMGHAYAPVVEATKEQIEVGSHLGYCNEWEVKFAEQVVKMVPCADLMRPTNSGTEANMYATRVARAYTGRKKIAKFQGHWHGGSDSLHKGTGYPFDVAPSAGLDESIQSNTLVLPFNDLEGVEREIRGSEDDVAAFLLEPVIGAGGCIPGKREFLKGMRELSDKIGALLIFDEVITGFRLAPGGAQELYGVMPDLAVFGKIVGGGGFPVGCFCGREDVMERIDHLKFAKSTERSFHGGTYTGNPLVARAGYTLLRDLERLKDQVYPHLFALGAKARSELEQVFEGNNFRAFVTGEGPLFCVHFTKEKPYDSRSANETKDRELTASYFRFMCANNVAFLTPQTSHCFVSAAHTMDEIGEFLALTERFIKTQRS